eukprot:CAMPEP_0175599388 /NCGR_PEP_ID=MMETSP0096-20121207/57045_1 /TAXON_ID=311494 /ORGANISM="Alexandrium monilatum, Strain CCMP3105" /LENGTH=47 /DNA_ID= /DNA_START= /DNA_END= /DNA_ORIENTATION=
MTIFRPFLVGFLCAHIATRRCTVDDPVLGEVAPASADPAPASRAAAT